MEETNGYICYVNGGVRREAADQEVELNVP